MKIAAVDNSSAIVRVREEIGNGFRISLAQYTALSIAGRNGFAVRVGQVCSWEGTYRHVYFGVTTRGDAHRWHQLRDDEREFAETLVRLGFKRGFGVKPLSNVRGIEWYLAQELKMSSEWWTRFRQRSLVGSTEEEAREEAVAS